MDYGDIKGFWVPIEIWKAEHLSIVEMHILSKIIELSRTQKCSASNKYFSEIYRISKSRVSQIISKLANLDYIKVTQVREGKQTVSREITLFKGLNTLFNTLCEPCLIHCENPIKYTKGGYLIYCEHISKELKVNKKSKKENIKRVATSKKITPPTQDEVSIFIQNYISEKEEKEKIDLSELVNAGFQSEQFFNHHSMNDWVMKNGRKIKDWRAAARYWVNQGITWAIQNQNRNKGNKNGTFKQTTEDSNSRKTQRMLEAFQNVHNSPISNL